MRAYRGGSHHGHTQFFAQCFCLYVEVEDMKLDTVIANPGPTPKDNIARDGSSKTRRVAKGPVIADALVAADSDGIWAPTSYSRSQ